MNLCFEFENFLIEGQLHFVVIKVIISCLFAQSIIRYSFIRSFKYKYKC